jgi:AraC-like DNA-binding protein
MNMTRSRSNAPYVRPAGPLFPGLPELLYAGKETARSARLLPPHKHDVLELCYIQRGQAQWVVEGKRYDICGGKMVVIRPHELHGGVQDVHQPCQYLFAGITLRPAMLGLSPLETKALARAIAQLHPRCFHAPPGVAEAFKLIIEARWQQHSQLELVAVKAALLQILTVVARVGHAMPIMRQSEVVRQAIKLMQENLECPLSLAAIAKRLGWSISHIKMRFRREMGVAPAEFYLRQRIARACAELTRTDQSVTQIGLCAGFSSSQHFATAFKRVTGSTPMAYRFGNQTNQEHTRKQAPLLRREARKP